MTKSELNRYRNVLEAKQAGKIRFIGFTGHKDPRIHLYMLETAAKYGFKFDTVQMPLNVMDAHFRSLTLTRIYVTLACAPSRPDEHGTSNSADHLDSRFHLGQGFG